jgi:hypothetical protein
MIPAFDLFDKAISADDVLKGDYVGHPFRGNQWTDASGAGAGGASSTPDQDKQAYDMRQSGKSWEEIAKELGYANGGSVRRLAMRHEKRLKDGGEIVVPKPVVPKPDLESDSETDTSKVADGLSIKRARRLLQQTFGGDLVGALTAAVMNGSKRVDLTAPMTDKEKQMVANMQEAGNLLAAAYKAEIAKLSGVDPAESVKLQAEYDQLNATLDKINNERYAMANGVGEIVQRKITKVDVGTFGAVAEGLIATHGDLRVIDPNTEASWGTVALGQGWGVDPNRQQSASSGSPEADLIRVHNAAVTSAWQLSRDFANGKINAEQLDSLLNNPQMLAMRQDSEWQSSDGRTGISNALGGPSRTGDDRYYVLPYDARMQYHAKLVREAFADKSVQRKISAAYLTNPDAPKWQEYQDRATELSEKLKGQSGPEGQRTEHAQQALNNVLNALGVKTGKAGSIGLSFRTGTGIIQGVGTSTPFEWNEGQYSKHKYDKAMRANIDNLTRLIPREFIRGTGSSLYAGQTGAPLNYEIEFGAQRAHAESLHKHTKLKLAAPPKSAQRGEIAKGGWASVLFHEMGHGIENNNPILRHLQAIYWKSRAGSETIQTMRRITGNTGYRSGEIGVKDNWLQGYAGKIYGGEAYRGRQATNSGSRGQNYEIFTTGLEALAFPEAATRIDADHFAFTLALLASASQVK